MSYKEKDKEFLKTVYQLENCRTWPYFPIVMPLIGGQGPASDNECDKITWEVWDIFCESYGNFDYLADAINTAIKMNTDLLFGTEEE